MLQVFMRQGRCDFEALGRYLFALVSREQLIQLGDVEVRVVLAIECCDCHAVSKLHVPSIEDSAMFGMLPDKRTGSGGSITC